MSNLLNRSKHEEFESNSALHIGNQKEIRAEKAGKSSSSQKGAKISHCAKMLLNFFALLTPFDFPFVILFFLILPFVYYGH